MCKLYINTRKEHLESNLTILKNEKNNKLYKTKSTLNRIKKKDTNFKPVKTIKLQ